MWVSGRGRQICCTQCAIEATPSRLWLRCSAIWRLQTTLSERRWYAFIVFNPRPSRSVSLIVPFSAFLTVKNWFQIRCKITHSLFRSWKLQYWLRSMLWIIPGTWTPFSISSASPGTTSVKKSGIVLFRLSLIEMTCRATPPRQSLRWQYTTCYVYHTFWLLFELNVLFYILHLHLCTLALIITFWNDK